LFKFPDCVRFIFILNEKNIDQRSRANPVPHPLLDRLMHIYIDYQVVAAHCPAQIWEIESEVDREVSNESFETIKSRRAELEKHECSDIQVLRRDLASPEDDSVMSHYSIEGAEDIHDDFQAFLNWIMDGSKALGVGLTHIRRCVILTRTSPLQHLDLKKLRILMTPMKTYELSDAQMIGNQLIDDFVSEKENYKVVLLRSSLFLRGETEGVLETDRRYRSILEQIAHESVQLILLVYSVQPNALLPGLSSLPGWPVFRLDDITRSALLGLPISSTARALRTGQFDLSDERYKQMAQNILKDSFAKVETDVYGDEPHPELADKGIMQQGKKGILA
jgi:hypothetical protein